jgi:hypothetical protein
MDCSSESDDHLNRCTKYLWKNPKSTTEEVSLALNIESSIIIKFIKKGDISKVFPNLTYPCDSCASPINDNRLCGKCSATFRGLANQIAKPKPLFTTGAFKISDRLRN